MVLALHALPMAGCLCLVVAMLCYPGGSWWDRQSIGASLVDTFLCDLMAMRSLNGAPNPVGARFGMAGMGLLLASLAPAWWLIGAPRHEDGVSRNARVLRARSWARTVGLAGLVPLAIALAMPGPHIHAVGVPSAGLMELGALVLVTAVTIGRATTRSLGLAGLALIAITLVGLGFYWPTVCEGRIAVRGLPAIQKLGVVALVVWTLIIARESGRPYSADP